MFDFKANNEYYMQTMAREFGDEEVNQDNLKGNTTKIVVTDGAREGDPKTPYFQVVTNPEVKIEAPSDN